MELEKMQKVNEILQLCFKINGLEARQKEKTGDKPTVSVWFSGHIASLDITIYEKGWDGKNKKASKSFYIFLSGYYEYINKQLDSCIHYLKFLEMRCNYEHLHKAI